MKMTAEKEPYTVIRTDYNSAVFIPRGGVFRIEVRASDLEEAKDIVLHVVNAGETFLFEESVPNGLVKKLHLSIVSVLANKGFVDCAYERDFLLRRCPRCKGVMEESQPHDNYTLYCPTCSWSAVGDTARLVYDRLIEEHIESTIKAIREQEKT